MNPVQRTLNSIDVGKAHINRILLSSVIPNSTNLPKVVEKIIRAYNETKKGRSDACYNPVPLPQDFTLEGYTVVRIYFAKPKQPLNKFAKMLKKVGCAVDFATTAIDFLFFLGRGEDLYALTSNHSWKVIKKYCDFQFPISIAKRLTHPKFIFTKTNPIVGQIISKEDAYQEEFQAQQHQLQNIWIIFTTFLSSLKEDCSIFQIDPFIPYARKKIMVTIGVGQLSFGIDMTLPHLCQTLTHLSKVYHGDEETYRADGTVEIDDPDYRFLDYIKPVKPGFHKTLNAELLSQVWHFFSKQIPFVDFFFCHRYTTDYCRSREFALTYKGNWTHTWHYPPSFFDVIHLLREKFPTLTLQSQFLVALKNMSLKYERKESSFPLKDFFQGEIRSSEGTFFRREGVWRMVEADYLIIVQRQFFELLSGQLIKGHLSKHWFRREEWTSFSLEEAVAKTGLSSQEVLNELCAVATEKFAILDKQGGGIVSPRPPLLVSKKYRSGKEEGGFRSIAEKTKNHPQ